MANYIIVNGELYHWGIKGQKWGVRRYQNKDGTLTPAGKQRYDDGDSEASAPTKEKKKSKHRLMLEEKFRKAGLSEEEAAKQANSRIRTEKILAITAGMTVAACTAYVIRNKIKERTDGLIKAGDMLQRVEMADTQGKLHDVFYASSGKHDNARYKGLLGMQRKQATGKAYLMEMSSKTDIKVASRDKASKVFEELYSSNSDFRKRIDEAIPDAGSMKSRLRYDKFNQALVDLNRTSPSTVNSFYGKLKSAGYGAIQDINDMKYSGYNAKNPLIIFGGTDNIMVKSFKEMTGDLAKSGNREMGKALAEQFVKTNAPLAAGLLTASTVSWYAQDHVATPEELRVMSKVPA